MVNMSDNATSNISMFNHLRAKISDPDNLKVTIEIRNIFGEFILIVIDTSHVIKLIRGCIGDMKILMNSTGKSEWRFVDKLQKVQHSNNLHLANKLRLKHIQYHRQKMKVYLATQTISNSVANAIEICDEKLKLKEFENSRETCKFLRIFISKE